MKTDRELLELAAKAIGGALSEGHSKMRTGPTWDTWEWSGPIGITTGPNWISYPGTTIYPLTDDGDNRRLQLAMRFALIPCEGGGWDVVSYDSESCEETLVATDADPNRAIVLAAASIGESMP